MANYSYVKTSSQTVENEYYIPIDESVSGIIFDIGGVLNGNAVFDNYSVAKSNFANNKVQKVKNLQEAVSLGITQNGILNGIAYYHIKEYYNYYGESKDLYIMFADVYGSSVDDSPFEEMMLQSEGNVFQVGVWTTNGVLTTDADDSLIFNNYLRNINAQLNMLNGSADQPSGYPSGLNAIVTGGLWIAEDPTQTINYKSLPDCTDIGLQRVSLLIGQDSYSSVKSLRTSTINNIGLVGIAMACLSLCYAEESIAYVGKFNLNKNDSFAGIEIPVGTDDISIDDINAIQIERLGRKGYIFPLKLEAKEGGLYFSSESTMTDDNFRSISFLRLKHKLKRVVKRTLTPQINGVAMYDKQINKLSDSTVTIFTNWIRDAIDLYMINADGQSQLSAYALNIPNEQDNLENGEMQINLSFVTLENQEVIDFVESYNVN